MLAPGNGRATPSNSFSMPAMILSNVDCRIIQYMHMQYANMQKEIEICQMIKYDACINHSFKAQFAVFKQKKRTFPDPLRPTTPILAPG